MNNSIALRTLIQSAITAMALMGTASVHATVVPAALFSENAVLQADREVPVWGWDNPGQNVTVSVGQPSVSGKTDQSGRWEVKLPAMKASEKPVEMTIAGSSTVAVKNILVGEVWVGSGQSNMAWTLNADFSNGDMEVAKKARAGWNYPQLRMFTVEEYMAAPEHIKDVKGKWTVCTPNTATTWSAAGYYFALDLQKELGGVPVGMIIPAVGGTQIASWINTKNYLELHPDIAAKTLKEIKDGAPKVEEYYAATYLSGKRPMRPVHVWPGGLYATMVAPLQPYAIKGICWYQGESDSYRKQPDDYAKSLDMLIKTWRSGWKEGDIPVIIVQLPNLLPGGGYGGPNTKALQEEPVEYEAQFPQIRDVQRLTVDAEKNAGLVVVIDHPAPNGVHPKGKSIFGRRWALQALKLAYGKKDLVASGPMCTGCEFKDGKAIVKFSDIGSGLAIRGDEPLKGFAIASKDGKFVWAKASIDGNTVVLSADDVKEPAAVRYSWAENPIGNLINKEGLPASPFKTDVADSAKK